ncbi:hypothetical protein [Mycolicibacterium fortuitum]|uniref:Uncharacterized protein n=1 Tax=Mycolicibacterium fortuitum TaxID=1766 RepID=A0AAE4VDW5_MYCFO|nr:hypothetical protein [Mycolicibacterium fortuitum]MCV7137704.1 hypothetical protein [Mycolicibacterium fortuitum]MDV7193276.1 hypothetical protein [Mycolicibacterium fortuitum]MDV7206044.1 hypothetical protein [Mycolicibacterium fortuitum]MDV7227456.1 hypothetical protein [Mycolicibacterium fortuitum]MDV7259846.1 hypothetical protein [Mycolicibacterium fortuitum]
MTKAIWQRRLEERGALDDVARGAVWFAFYISDGVRISSGHELTLGVEGALFLGVVGLDDFGGAHPGGYCFDTGFKAVGAPAGEFFDRIVGLLELDGWRRGFGRPRFRCWGWCVSTRRRQWY